VTAGAETVVTMTSMPRLVDETDETIIAMLQEDGRRSYGGIARAVGLSEAATRQRVNRLRERGLLRIVAVTDPVALGLRVVALVGIKVAGDVRVVAKRLAEVHAIEYVVICAGAFDLIVEIVCEDEQALLDLINDEIRSDPGVRDTESFIYLHIEKQVYGWGRTYGRGESRASSAALDGRG
jgi:Lrp/AsnC family transcriptional regulator, regulator for asnA, asnC and gidA